VVLLVAGLTTRLEEEIRAAVHASTQQHRTPKGDPSSTGTSTPTQASSVLTAPRDESNADLSGVASQLGESEDVDSTLNMSVLKDYVGIPKALLPGPDGKPLLSNWWAAIQQCRALFSDVRAVRACPCNCRFIVEIDIVSLINSRKTSIRAGIA
jgi:hypothetical protein